MAPDPRLRELKRSPHRGLDCASCHAGASEAGHEKLAPVDCGGCHASPTSELRGSQHGSALLKKRGSLAAACAACHGAGHAVLRVKDPASPAARREQPKTCGQCHQKNGEVPARLSAKHPIESYAKTVHGLALVAGSTAAASCADCHGSHDIRPGADPGSRIAGRNLASTCGRCHRSQVALFEASVHGQAVRRGVRAAPVCVDCHGEHTIRGRGDPESAVAPGRRAKACEECHRSERIASRFGLPADRVRTYEASFHGMAGKGGDVKVADCASCHGWHDVLPSSSPASRIHPSRLAETCGQCHPGAGKRWAASGIKVHEALGREGGGSVVARWVALFYAFVIPLTAFGMLAHNTLDLARKARLPRRPRHREGEVPLNVSERWQHGANAAAFILLAYSGFALQHPGSWWAWPLSTLGGEAVRRNAHRAAAALFLATGAAHLAYLATKRGRSRLLALLPAWRDLEDPVALAAYNAGLSAEAPALPQFSYIEKFEYWALIWGSLVMTATGGLLLFHNAALASFPLWTVEVARVAHYLEAVLACLAILIWHGYWVILDPDVYPMDWAWLFGSARLPGIERRKDGS